MGACRNLRFHCRPGGDRSPMWHYVVAQGLCNISEIMYTRHFQTSQNEEYSPYLGDLILPIQKEHSDLQSKSQWWTYPQKAGTEPLRDKSLAASILHLSPAHSCDGRIVLSKISYKSLASDEPVMVLVAAGCPDNFVFTSKYIVDSYTPLAIAGKFNGIGACNVRHQGQIHR